MSATRTTLDVHVRPYDDADEGEVVELLRTALGPGPTGDRTARFFRWKHLENPFGRSCMLVATAGERIVGFRALLRWRFSAGGREVRAVRAVDTATHPAFQGRGVFSTLTRAALDAVRGDTDLVFNTPNDRSGPGYLKLGWREVGRLPVSIRVQRPFRFARGAARFRSGAGPARPHPDVRADRAANVLADDSLSALLDAAPDPGGLSTPRTLSYLRWRYAGVPDLDYRAIRSDRDGLALFRVRPRGPLWEATLTEAVAPGGDPAAAARLLRAVAAAAGTDHVAAHLPAGAGRRARFLRAPGGMRFVVNPLRPGLDPDPAELRSWSLSLGDLEVF